jgi:hypothetical protein
MKEENDWKFVKLWRNIKLFGGMFEERAECMEIMQIYFTFINEFLISDDVQVEMLIVNFDGKW